MAIHAVITAVHQPNAERADALWRCTATVRKYPNETTASKPHSSLVVSEAKHTFYAATRDEAFKRALVWTEEEGVRQ